MAISFHVGFEGVDFRPGPGKLYITDPLTQTNLLPIVAKGTKPVSYLNYYDVDEMVRCAFCNTHQHHSKGFTVEMADGSIALCGRNCAEEFFGRDVAKELLANLTQRINRERRSATIAATFAGVPELRARISDDVVEAERIGLGLIAAITAAFPKKALARLCADDVFGVSGRFLSLHRSQPLAAHLRELLEQMKLAVQRDGEMSDIVLKRAIEARKTVFQLSEQLADFITAMSDFMDLENLWNLVQFHATDPAKGTAMSFKKPISGVELHISREDAAPNRFRLIVPPTFDRAEVIGLLTQDMSLTE
ncbi:hypothetical protein [Paracoccus sp. (in: a-proteobacteria)]|uniref:hypothetical protein n=1 Tax=Paracoccus sp. TaxID=267 RepID=UPI0028B0E22F|nr:hypothetical protein [Paracoccus sp. (in: a-proteobacteria)]